MGYPEYESPAGLPSFEDPPVAEAVIGVEFEALGEFGAVALVGLADRWARDYPVSREMPGLPPSVGAGGAPLIQFGLMSGGIPIRLWLVSRDEQSLVQIQNDRLVLNWRAVGTGAQYPRYRALREEFAKRWDDLVEYAQSRSAPAIHATYVESTFVNQYSISAANADDAGLSFVRDLPDNMPGEGRSFQFQLTQSVTVDGISEGQLSVNGGPFVNEVDRRYQLTVTTKLKAPDPCSIDRLLPVIDAAHDVSVRGFDAATSSRQHSQWRRT